MYEKHDLHKFTDEKLQEKIACSLLILHEDTSHWSLWYRQIQAELVKAYQAEQARRQTERVISVIEELTDVIRRKKIGGIRK